MVRSTLLAFPYSQVTSINHGNMKIFLYYLALAITANCISENNCLALDGFDLKTVHKLSSKEKKSQQCWNLNLGLLDEKR